MNNFKDIIDEIKKIKAENERLSSEVKRLSDALAGNGQIINNGKRFVIDSSDSVVGMQNKTKAISNIIDLSVPGDGKFLRALNGQYQASLLSMSDILAGSLTQGYLPYFNTNAWANSPIYTDGTNTGISTVSPAEKLHLYQTQSSPNYYATTLELESYSTTHGQGSNAKIGYSWIGDLIYDVNRESAGGHLFRTNVGGTLYNRFFIANDGKVAVGITNPDLGVTLFTPGMGFSIGPVSPSNYPFQIVAPYDVSSPRHIQFGNNGVSGTFDPKVDINCQTGSVGIGTTSPDEKLHVVGNVKISSLAGTGTRNVVVDANGVLSAP